MTKGHQDKGGTSTSEITPTTVTTAARLALAELPSTVLSCVGSLLMTGFDCMNACRVVEENERLRGLLGIIADVAIGTR